MAPLRRRRRCCHCPPPSTLPAAHTACRFALPCPALPCPALPCLQDSLGNYESLPRGCVQYLSAGRGVVHSEMNDGDKTSRFIQVRRHS